MISMIVASHSSAMSPTTRAKNTLGLHTLLRRLALPLCVAMQGFLSGCATEPPFRELEVADHIEAKVVLVDMTRIGIAGSLICHE